MFQKKDPIMLYLALSSSKNMTRQKVHIHTCLFSKQFFFLVFSKIKECIIYYRIVIGCQFLFLFLFYFKKTELEKSKTFVGASAKKQFSWSIHE